MSGLRAAAGHDPLAGMLDSMRYRIDCLRLDLSGCVVATEAATQAYACTAVLAAMAGAQVYAVARERTRYGSFEDAAGETLALARAAGVADRIEVDRTFGPGTLERCDILTNSGALRPITRSMIERLPRGAVIGLMFEAWEFREADLDLAACRERGIAVAAVNECHPDVDVFSFLGPLCCRQLHDCGQVVRGARIALLCDNPFAPFLEAGLREAGAEVTLAAAPEALDVAGWDAVVVALDPTRNRPLSGDGLERLARLAPGARLVQFWGDIDREAARALGFERQWPPIAPSPGHMGILLNALGDEPIIRLQAGGLRAAEIAWRGEGRAIASGISVLL